MGFLTRLLAGLTAAAALGAGLTGTANAVDVTGATGNTKSVVKLTADDTNNLPDHIVNGSFDYPSVPSWTGLAGSSSNKNNKGKRFATINPGTGKYGSGCAMSTTGRAIPNWNRSNFAWNSTQGDAHYPGMSCEAGNVELNYDSVHHNQFAELTADQQGTAIYQDVKVTPGTMMTWSLKHSSATSAYVDKMQVMIGEPYKETAQEATRIASENGNKVGEKMTTISTPTTSDRADNKKWDTYSGTYLVPDGVTTVRFTFKSVASAEWYSGNDLDDIEFSRSYKLTYDKNSSDAAGQVPSNQRGKENTVQPAKSKTTGTVKTVVDTSDGLPTELVNGDFEYPVKSDMPVNDGNFWYISQNDGSYFANGTVLGKRYKLPEGFDKAKFAWHSTQTGDTYYPDLERADDVQVDYKADGTNHYSEISAAQSGATIYQDVATVPGVMYKWSLKHASLDSSHLDKMSVIIGEPGKETAQEATRTTANGHGDKLGKVGTVISTKVSNPEMPAGNKFQEGAHTGQWETYTGTYIATGTVTRFAFRSVEGYSAWDGNLLDDISFSKAYKLTYDKNASDATGSVPSDTTANTVKQAKADATGTVKTVADTNASLPDHLVNGDFNVNYHDQWKDSFGGWTSIDPNAGKTLHATSLPNGSSWKWTAINGWDKSKFGWTSTQKAGSNVQQKANAVELQYDDSTADNVYAELCAYEAGTAIYQDIRTVPGTLYKVRLKHASLNSTYLDKMQVMIGTPGHEQPVEMTRTTVNGHGDKLNEKSTTIATKVTNSNNRHHADQWETYEGTYLIPDGQTTTRFTFKSIDAKQLDYGNVLDDIVFDKAYRLSYDKNASDATGQVPSNQRGKENTTQPAKDKTSGSVKLVADDDVAEYAANGLPRQIVNSDFDHDWRNIVSQSKMSAKYNFANIDPAHGDVEISGALNSKGEASKQWVHLNGFDASQFGWKSNQTDTRVDGRDGIVEIQRSRANDNMYAEITASQANTYLYQDIDTAHDYPTVYTVKLRYAHRNGTINSNEKIQILVGAPGHEQPVEMTRIASDRGNKVGEKSTTVNAPNTDGWLGSWDTFQGSVVVPAGQDISRFTFKALGSIDGISGNLIDDVQFKLAYKLSYDKNAADASGQVPSNTTPDTTQTASSKSTGKVSDLVQRTTTHEDGSVTVKTIDTSTDVVSGCQVYYPAGQKITLATMAKDDDCWDSSMLSRPGHTQLGWNQDRNATQAQAQVTMVEGGMTVYAVWVGNPVLTYDTNKPSTWSGQMPSTPASVSVPYNAPAADGSGWRAGDTTKIRGYRFLGWYTGPQDNAGLYDWTRPLTGSVTVYAHWQRLQANVVYNANGGTGSHPNTTGWQYSDVTIPGDTSKSFKRDKYVFKGWGTKPGKADVVYKDGSKVALQDKDITLYAQWQEVHENFVETGGIGLPIAIAGGVLLLMFGIGSTVMLTRRMNGHGMPDDE